MRYQDYEIASEIRRATATILEPLRDASLRDAYERIEAAVPALVQRAVAIELRAIAVKEGVTYIEGPLGAAVYASIPHEIVVTPHHTRPTLLLVTVRAPLRGSSPLVRGHGNASVARLGRFSQVRTTTSRILASHRDELAGAGSRALQAAYEELMAWTLSRFAGIRDDAATALYARLRELIPESLRDAVWLYAFASGQGFYVPDSRARDVLFDRVGQRTLNTTQSPIALAADFLAHVLPYDKTYSKNAVEAGTPIEGVFATAPYADGGLEITEAAVYQTAALFTQPVASAGKAILLAGYPSQLRSELEIPIQRAAKVLQPVLANTASALHQQLAQIKELDPTAQKTFGRTIAKHIGVRPMILGLVDVDIKGLITDLAGKKHVK